MHQAEALGFHPFDGGARLGQLFDFDGGRQVSYLCDYLEDLNASFIIEEPHYFDRDYLAEVAAFYSSSSRGYKNICLRLHFFRRE